MITYNNTFLAKISATALAKISFYWQLCAPVICIYQQFITVFSRQEKTTYIFKIGACICYVCAVYSAIRSQLFGLNFWFLLFICQIIPDNRKWNKPSNILNLHYQSDEMNLYNDKLDFGLQNTALEFKTRHICSYFFPSKRSHIECTILSMHWSGKLCGWRTSQWLGRLRVFLKGFEAYFSYRTT